MPSTYSSRLRLNFQAPGDNLNTWGVLLNGGVFQLLEDALSRRLAFALSGPKVLGAANGAEDEARCMYLDVTGGAGGVITAPAVEKLYVLRNDASGDVSVTTGAGQSALVRPGEVVWLVCDAANVRRVQATDLGGARLTGAGAPIAADDVVTKAYADGLAFNQVDLPGQGPGTVGKYVRSDGAIATWGGVSVGDVAGAAPQSAPVFTDGVTIAGATKSNVGSVPAADIDTSSADYFVKSISANTTFTFSAASAGKAQGFILELTISSGALPTWPGSVEWSGGFEPTFGNGKHLLGFISRDGGTSWLGLTGGANFS